MTTLKIDDQTARLLHEKEMPELNLILEKSFPEGFFSRNIIDRTPTLEDLFRIGGKIQSEIVSANDTKDEIAYKILKFGINVLNEGVKVDHSNSNQVKYEPRFYHKSGFGLSYGAYAYWATITNVGPRLCYLDYNVMMHGIKIMEKYYHDFYN
ncbi:MAG TPA: hypothetical protein VN722_12090 [Hanamia sp.]|nr:hypothetical protein [Hanamia sp.]